MSSFAELYSDYKNTIDNYVPKVNITEVQFMRDYTKGMQEFQRSTKLVEAFATLTVNVDETFNAPRDMLFFTEAKDENNFTLVIQDFSQFARNQELWDDGQLVTPLDYALRMPEYRQDFEHGGRLLAYYPRKFQVYPYDDDTEIYLWYVPDLHAFSNLSFQWNTGTLAAPAGWFPLNTNFFDKFREAGVVWTLQPYEDTFLDWALMKFCENRHDDTALYYRKKYYEAVNRAILEKPTYMKEAVVEYNMNNFNSAWIERVGR